MSTQQRRGIRFWLICGGMAASFLAGSWLAPRVRIEWEPGRLPSQALAEAPHSRLPNIGPDEPVARAVALAGPSVVNIDTVSRVVQDDWFLGPTAYEAQGAGSGVIIDPRGYVLTNEHVVAGATRITVTFGNGKKYRGEVLGSDQESDVGLIRLINPPANLPVAHLGDSRNLIPGQWAVAIGNPYGYQQTVTVGVVSHTGRAVQVDDRVYKSLIQTDAAINPGNSGGALLDIHGNLIGINTVVRRDARGIGFAIPIDVAKSIADELIRSGKVKRPWTGLNVQDAVVRTVDGPQRLEGALVDGLDRRGPAYKAGIRPGDLIREVEGHKVRSRTDVDAVLKAARIGQRIHVVVERDGELLKGEIPVTERPG